MIKNSPITHAWVFSYFIMTNELHCLGGCTGLTTSPDKFWVRCTSNAASSTDKIYSGRPTQHIDPRLDERWQMVETATLRHYCLVLTPSWRYNYYSQGLGNAQHLMHQISRRLLALRLILMHHTMGYLRLWNGTQYTSIRQTNNYHRLDNLLHCVASDESNSVWSPYSAIEVIPDRELIIGVLKYPLYRKTW